MLQIFCPKDYTQEREYIYSVIFKEFLGQEYSIIYQDRKGYIYVVAKDDCYNQLCINDTFFSITEDLYLSNGSLPIQPLAVFNASGTPFESVLTNPLLPVIYGKPIRKDEYIHFDNTRVDLGIDIFGSAFFMLTRYEEVVKPKRDEHGRFMATSSLAYQEGFLTRPIINEYLEILWWAIQKLWPGLKRKRKKFRVLPTHDIDRIIAKANLSWYQHVRELLGDLLKRRDGSLFLNNLRLLWKIRPGDYEAEWDYTFRHIMDISEAIGGRSTFFFMTAQGLSEYDGNYDTEGELIGQLAREIKRRGHRVGLHPSYVSFKNMQVIEDNLRRLKRMLAGNDLTEYTLGARQHYLRWEAKETWRHYENAGLKYDTTLTYADYVGFRCGICYEYPVFDVLQRRRLDLWEWPLIVMDCSFWGYMKISWDEMLKLGIDCKRVCEKFNGNFILLWHNDMFLNNKRGKLYEDLVVKA